MAKIPVAVEGLTIIVVPPAAGEVKIDSVPSKISKVNGKGVYFKEVSFSVSKIKLAVLGSVTLGTASGKLIITAQNSKTDAGEMLREKDMSAPISAVVAQHAGPNSSKMPSSISITVKIEKAGQSIFTSL